MPEPTSTFCARAETDRTMANSANPFVLIKLRMWLLLRNRSRLPDPPDSSPHPACYKPPVGREHPMTPFLPPLPRGICELAHTFAEIRIATVLEGERQSKARDVARAFVELTAL